MEKIMEMLRAKHGDDLTLRNGEKYFLFLKDGLYTVYLDEQTLKIDVELLNEGKIFVYHSEKSLDELI